MSSIDTDSMKIKKLLLFFSVSLCVLGKKFVCFLSVSLCVGDGGLLSDFWRSPDSLFYMFNSRKFRI